MLNEIKKSIISGILISIGGCVFISCKNDGMGWLGAILFSVGLYTICEYGFNLYTGKVGYIGNRLTDWKYIGFVLQVLVFNLLTTFAVGALLSTQFTPIAETAGTMYAAKLASFEANWFKSFVSAIFCGMLMYIAVDCNKRGSKIGIFLAVPTFILSGFDHSIANSFYNGLALGENTFTVTNALFVIVVVLGNALGGMLLPLLTRSWSKEKQAQ